MANVNQPPLKLPKAWMLDNELRSFAHDLTYVVFQLWNRTGGGAEGGGFDQIEENTNNIAGIVNGFDEQYINPTQFQKIYFESVQSNDYTTWTDEIIKLSANVNITLNPNPLDSERVYVKSTGLGFKVISDRLIDGHREIVYSKPYIGRWYSYSAELDTWSIL